MTAIRMVLWVGPGERFAGELADAAPGLDFVWEQEASNALALRADAFDAVVLDADASGRTLGDLRTLAQHFADTPIVVRLGSTSTSDRHRLEAAGAARIIERRRGASRASALGDALAEYQERRDHDAPRGL